MEPRSLSYIRAACAAELRSGSPQTIATRVCTDSRQARPGDLFFALRGDRFDGHDFLPDVTKAGAAGLVIENGRLPREALECAVLAVPDTRRALGQLAGRYRMDFDLPMVAVAGSNGKTTTKELIASVLRERGPALSSEASFNNDIGVPMTLLRLEHSHWAAVLEAGTNHPGELAPLLRMIQPRFGVLTSIGREHLEFFGDLAGVAQEEGWLAELLPTDGRLFIGGDSEWTPKIERRCPATVVRVGLGERNDWRAGQVRVTDTGVRFQVRAPRAEFSGQYEIHLLGRHQVHNALFAVALAAELGLSPEAARRGLARCSPPKMRLQIWEAHGLRVLDDAYNANADSMLAALHTLCDLPCAGRRVAVLGDMAELGEHTAAAHEEIGRKVSELGITRLVTIGQWARHTAAAARRAGLKDVTEFADVPSAAAALPDLLGPGDLVLLKGSRAAGLEPLGQVLRRQIN